MAGAPSSCGSIGINTTACNAGGHFRSVGACVWPCVRPCVRHCPDARPCSFDSSLRGACCCVGLDHVHKRTSTERPHGDRNTYCVLCRSRILASEPDRPLDSGDVGERVHDRCAQRARRAKAAEARAAERRAREAEAAHLASHRWATVRRHPALSLGLTQRWWTQCLTKLSAVGSVHWTSLKADEHGKCAQQLDVHNHPSKVSVIQTPERRWR